MAWACSMATFALSAAACAASSLKRVWRSILRSVDSAIMIPTYPRMASTMFAPSYALLPWPRLQCGRCVAMVMRGCEARSCHRGKRDLRRSNLWQGFGCAGLPGAAPLRTLRTGARPLSTFLVCPDASATIEQRHKQHQRTNLCRSWRKCNTPNGVRSQDYCAFAVQARIRPNVPDWPNETTVD